MANAATQVTPKLVVRKLIHAKREAVYKAWTDPRIVEKWLVPPKDWHARAKTDVRLGGKYTVEMIVAEEDCVSKTPFTPGQVLVHDGEYLELVPPEKLVFSWNSPFVQNTRVTVELKDLGENTELWLTHEFLPNEKEYLSHQAGWEACTEKLDILLQSK